MTTTLNASTSGVGGFIATGDNSGSLALQTAGTTALTVDSSQNVGIGTTSPASKLDVITNSSNNARLLFTSDANGQAGIQAVNSTNTGTIALGLNVSGGNVGIGTSSPVTKLTVTGGNGNAITSTNTGSQYSGFEIANNGTNKVTLQYDNTNGIAALNTRGGNPFTFGTADTERMRIDSSGNLLVGTTTATAKNYTVQTANAIALGAENQVSSFTSTILRTGAYGTVPGTGFRHIECLGSSAQTLFQVLGNGNAQNSNNSYGAISDIKLKENIVDASPKLASLMQVKVRNYNLKTDQTHKQIGVIAQELEQVFPSMVEETPDRDIEGNDLGTTTKAVKYSVFVPMLIKAIQELKAINDTQAETINALTARIVAIESKA